MLDDMVFRRERERCNCSEIWHKAEAVEGLCGTLGSFAESVSRGLLFIVRNFDSSWGFI